MTEPSNFPIVVRGTQMGIGKFREKFLGELKDARIDAALATLPTIKNF
jgi:hypothetical protein